MALRNPKAKGTITPQVAKKHKLDSRRHQMPKITIPGGRSLRSNGSRTTGRDKSAAPGDNMDTVEDFAQDPSESSTNAPPVPTQIVPAEASIPADQAPQVVPMEVVTAAATLTEEPPTQVVHMQGPTSPSDDPAPAGVAPTLPKAPMTRSYARLTRTAEQTKKAKEDAKKKEEEKEKEREREKERKKQKKAVVVKAAAELFRYLPSRDATRHGWSERKSPCCFTFQAKAYPCFSLQTEGNDPPHTHLVVALRRKGDTAGPAFRFAC